MAGSACTETLFTKIGDQVASPTAVAVDPAGLRAYLVNSNQRLKYLDTTVMVLNITNPQSPTLIKTAAIPNFSGQASLDLAQKRLYVPNRLSEDNLDPDDRLLQINLDEGSPDFLSVTELASGDSPFGIACCDTGGRFYVATNGGALLRYDPAGNLATFTSLQFSVDLSSGETVEGKGASEVALIGDQAFVTTRGGEIFVVNLAELGGTTQSLDYVITSETEDFRGIATNGKLLYVADGNFDNPSLLVIDPSDLKPSDSVATTEVALSTVVKQTMPLGQSTDEVLSNPNEVVYFDARKEVYVSDLGKNNIVVVNVLTGEIAATLNLNSNGFVSDQPFGLAPFSLGGTDYLYVTNLASDNLLVVDLATRTVVGKYP